MSTKTASKDVGIEEKTLLALLGARATGPAKAAPIAAPRHHGVGKMDNRHMILDKITWCNVYIRRGSI